MYPKHGNLVDADASGIKSGTKYLESREIMCALESEISKERSERLGQPRCHSAPPV